MVSLKCILAINATFFVRGLHTRYHVASTAAKVLFSFHSMRHILLWPTAGVVESAGTENEIAFTQLEETRTCGLSTPRRVHRNPRKRFHHSYADALMS